MSPRVKGFLEFFISIFGALAILGVFFKIMKWPHYEMFMIAGFMGEVAAFTALGFFALVKGFRGQDDPVSGPGSVEPGGPSWRAMGAGAGVEMRDAITQLNEEVRSFGIELQQMREEMASARGAVREAKGQFDRLGGEGLDVEHERMGQQLRQFTDVIGKIADDLQGVHAQVHGLHSGFSLLADGDFASSVKQIRHGVNHLGGAMDEMGTEMHNASRSISMMQAELDRVASGDLAGDAEGLGRGMKQLSAEMQQAGKAVSGLRNDLDVMARRFHQFNDPTAASKQNGTSNHTPRRA